MKKLYYALVILILVGIDQFSKTYAQTHFDPSVKVFDFFNLELAHNSGIAFSLPVPQWVVILLTISVLLWISHQIFFKSPSGGERTAFILISSGAVGNLIDRILQGTVTDFLAFWNFPIFNLADSFITVGIVLFLWEEIFPGE